MPKTNQIEIIRNLNSLDQLKPLELASLLTFLITKERAPGGPYLLSKNVQDNQLLNAKIYHLFAQKNKILKNTLAYLDQPEGTDSNMATTNKTQIVSTPIPMSHFIHQAVLKQSARMLTPESYEHILPILNAIIQRDNEGEITQLSSFFIDSLNAFIKSTPPKKQLFLLGEANFYTWVAYSLYDNLIDNSQPNPIYVSAANIFHRLAISTYIDAGVSLKKLASALNSVDRANADEVANNRLTIEDQLITIEKIPAKKNLRKLLSARSSVHCIGPLELISKLSNSPVHYRTYKGVLNLYCAARQLSDDIHDWEVDILQGHVSYVVAHLLQAASIADGTYSLDSLIPQLRTAFWEGEMDNLIDECLQMCTDAQNALEYHLRIKPNSSFERITLQPIIDACISAKETTYYTKSFLRELKY